MKISKSLEFYRRKVQIDKRRGKAVARQIQIYNNRLVDGYIYKYNDGDDDKPTEQMIFADLRILNEPHVYRNYQRILNSPYTSNEAFFSLFIKNQANKDLDNIAKLEMERICKNLDYVENFIKNHEVPSIEYKKILDEKKDSSIASRLDILKEVAEKSNELLIREGLNIPQNVFTYRNLDATARSLTRQSQMNANHERALSINEEAQRNGKSPVYTKKRWIWTGNGKTTRHFTNANQVREINEPFVITNDATGDIDLLQYPMDPDGSYSNAWCCYCEVEYF